MKFSNNFRKLVHYTRNGAIFSIVLAKIKYSLKSIIRNITGFEWEYHYLLSLKPEVWENLSKTDMIEPNIMIANAEDWNEPIFVEELGAKKIDYIRQRCNDPEYDCIVYKDKLVQCFGFISYGELELNDNIRYNLPVDEAFLYDDYCMISFRRRGLYRKVLDERIRILKNKGIKRITTLISTANKPSLQAHKKTWKIEQKFFTYKFRGKEYCTLKHYSRK